MKFISVSKQGLQDSPAVIVDRLRSAWINPGVHLILEGVFLQIADSKGKLIPDSSDEHMLFGFESRKDDTGSIISLLKSFGLSNPTLWEESSVFTTVENAAKFHIENEKIELAAAIYQRFAEALPDSYIALSNAGRIFLKLQNTILASEYLSQAYHLAPEVPEVAINYYLLLIMEKKVEEADDMWKAIKRKFPNHPAVQEIISIS